MKISTKGRYALRLMIDLAQNRGNGFIALKDISTRQEISKKYLEQIIPLLNRSNLLTANKGHMGGYQLAKDPDMITVKDIILSTEGSLSTVSCMQDDPNRCKKCDTCLTLPIYEGLSKVLSDYLESITLADIIRPKDKQTDN